MGCANTKSGGATACGSAEDCIPEGGDTTAQKELPKVMVDGDDMAVNGNVVNANGIEEGTTEEGKEPACNGDLIENKRKSKAAIDAAEEECKSGDGVTTPSGDVKSNEMNGGEAVMAADSQDGEDEKETGDSKKEDEETDQQKDESSENAGSSPTDDAAESRESNQEGGEE